MDALQCLNGLSLAGQCCLKKSSCLLRSNSCLKAKSTVVIAPSFAFAAVFGVEILALWAVLLL